MEKQAFKETISEFIYGIKVFLLIGLCLFGVYLLFMRIPIFIKETDKISFSEKATYLNGYYAVLLTLILLMLLLLQFYAGYLENLDELTKQENFMVNMTIEEIETQMELMEQKAKEQIEQGVSKTDSMLELLNTVDMMKAQNEELREYIEQELEKRINSIVRYWNVDSVK